MNTRLLTETEAAYLAGFADGEASIGLHHFRHPKGDRQPRFSITLQISNINHEVILWMQERTGGSIYTRQPSQDRRRVLYCLQVPSVRCCAFLKQVLPFLIVKREQAELAIEFHERFYSTRWPRGRHRKDSAERYAEMLPYDAAMKALRG